MATSNSYIDVSGTVILSYTKVRGRVPAAIDRHIITDPQELRLLENISIRLLKWESNQVQQKTQQEIDQEEQAKVTDNDAEWLNEERRLARDSVKLDLLNELRALHSLPALTAADIESAYDAKLAAKRSGRR